VGVGKRAPAAIQQSDEVGELELVRLATAGDRDAFHSLFDRYHARIYRYALLRVADPEVARDLAQEVFLAVWKGLGSFAAEHSGSFPAWLFGIARNVVGTHRRRARRAVPVPNDQMPETTVEFEAGVVNRRVLVDSMATLPDDQREVLVLRFIVGLPAKDVAVIMDRSEGAVTAIQLRALDKLRKWLAMKEAPR
jgi:RNA polymerase sigma-70 factor, ECF subfamily